MAKKEDLLKLAALILSSAAPVSQAAGAGKTPEVQCFGLTHAKGENACGVDQSQIDMANRIYANKFTKSTTHTCHAAGAGSAKEGVLSFLPKPSEDECFKAGGFIFAKNDKGQLTIKDKDGVKI